MKAKSKLFFFNLGHGHIHPTLAIVEDLVEAGAEVTYYAPAEFAEAIQTAGGRHRLYPTQFGQPGADTLPKRILADTAHVLPRLAETVQQEKPDAILYDPICVTGRVLAEWLRVPHVALFASYPANAHFRIEADFFHDVPLGAHFRASMAEILRPYGVAPFGIGDVFSPSAPLNIVFMPREFHPCGDTFDERYLFVGPSLLRHEAPADLPPGFLNRGDLLYVSLGTVFNQRPDFFSACVDAFRSIDRPVLISLGNRLDPAGFGKLPDHIQMRSFVPQHEVLRHTRDFVTHGGMNSVQGALYYGIPLVVVPQMVEQATTARRVEELGAGFVLDSETLSGVRLREAVERLVTTSSFRERARAFGEKSHRTGGAKRASQAIRKYLPV